MDGLRAAPALPGAATISVAAMATTVPDTATRGREILHRLRAGCRPAVALCAGAAALLPSVSEAMPLVALEAMACGTPVLATRIAGLPTIVRDYETGVLVDPGDVAQMTLALRLLLRDTALLAEMSAEARRMIQQRFMWTAVAAEYVRLYRSLSADAGKPPVPPPDSRRAPVPVSAGELQLPTSEPPFLEAQSHES